MSNPWTTTALLASIRRRARSTNSAAPGYANADLLEMADEELTSKLVPEMVKLRRDWFEVVRDVTLTVGRSTYQLWTRTIMGSARDVGIVSGGVFRALSYLSPEAMDGKDPTTQASPTHYTIRGTDVVLYPTPNIADALRITYLRRRNRLVLPTAAGVVATLTYPADATKITINLTADASTYGITTATPVDLIRGRPPFDSLLDDSLPYAVATSAVGLQPGADGVTALAAGVTGVGVAGSPDGLYVGDYVCLAGDSPVIQGPPEMLAILAQRVANALMRPGRDKELLAAGERELAALEAAVFGVADRRVESDSQTVGNGPWA